jgi:organic radical activating enzyme
MNINDLALLAKDYNNLVITGGEPLLQQETVENLVCNFFDRDVKITIETNGSVIPKKSLCEAKNVLFSVSPKTSDALENVVNYFWKHQIKLVYTQDKFFEKAFNVLHKAKGLYIMPLTKKDGTNNSKECVQFCLKNKVAITERLHTIWKIP